VPDMSAGPGPNLKAILGYFERVRRHLFLGLAAPSRPRVCNAVCNWFGHNQTHPGTTWRNLDPAESPQARSRGTPRHD
jgi:hypothetical protein